MGGSTQPGSGLAPNVIPLAPPPGEFRPPAPAAAEGGKSGIGPPTGIPRSSIGIPQLFPTQTQFGHSQTPLGQFGANVLNQPLPLREHPITVDNMVGAQPGGGANTVPTAVPPAAGVAPNFTVGPTGQVMNAAGNIIDPHNLTLEQLRARNAAFDVNTGF